MICSPQNIVWVIISRRMRWTGHVARMGDTRGAYSVLVRSLREIDDLEVLRLDGRIY
jgi:hypothetical protein